MTAMTILRITFLMMLFCHMDMLAYEAAPDSAQILMQKYASKTQHDPTGLQDVQDYIHWAKRRHSNPDLAQAYKDAVFFIRDPAQRLRYADSALAAAWRTCDYELITSAYLGKGIVYYFSFRQYRKALDQYLQAAKYAEMQKDDYLQYKVRYHLAVVRTYTGEYSEAAELLEKCIRYYRRGAGDHKDVALQYNNRKGYYNSLHQLAACRRYQGDWQAAGRLVSLGLRLTADDPDFELEHAYFLKCRGIAGYHLGHYAASLTDLRQAATVLKRHDDFAWLSVTYSFIARDLMEIGDRRTGLQYAQRVDSVFAAKGFILPELEAHYYFFQQDAHRHGDAQAELGYSQKLLVFFRNELGDLGYLTGRLNQYASTDPFGDEDGRAPGFLRSGLIALLLILTAWAALLRSGHWSGWLAHVQFPRWAGRRAGDSLYEDAADRPESLLSDRSRGILKRKMDRFEATQGYTEPGLTQQKLAYRFGVNSNYLSQYINKTYDVHFNRYLSALCIHYIMQKLQSDPHYRHMTISALAAECGFASRQHFSDTFYVISGMRPNDYIQQLKQNPPQA